MIDLNDVLLAMSNIPVDDPIAEIWGRGLQGGYKIIKYTGTLPINISANGEVLIDYRIYGADVGVGEQTENLFDIRKVNNPPKCTYSGSTFSFDGQSLNYDILCKTNGAGATPDPEKMIAVSPGTYTIIMGNGTIAPDYSRLNVRFFDEETAKTLGAFKILPQSYTVVVENDGYLSFMIGSGVVTIADLMLVKGSTAPESYEPYGYKLPMTVSDGNTVQNVPVYIGENQLSEDEYVSYAEQKIYRDVNGTLTPTDPPVPLPEIPTIKGETVIDYDGTPNPSQMYVKYKGKG